MKFVHLTDSAGLHQIAVADEMFKILGNDFTFIELFKDNAEDGIHKEAEKGMDYSDRPYILRSYKSAENMAMTKQLIDEADALRCGSIDMNLLDKRIANKRLTFWTTERLYKRKLNMFGPRCIMRCIRLNAMFRHNPNMYLLANGAYVAQDFRFYPSIRSHVLQWGYFPLLQDIDADKLVHSKPQEKIQILWCARMIDWKHPEMVPMLAHNLIDRGIRNFVIKMIGTGYMTDTVSQQIIKLGVSENVVLLGGLPNNVVVKEMQSSNIFIFTSDRQEGWGVVLNEAMNAGCAVVSSDEIGATKFLVSNLDNGMIFKSCCDKDLCNKVASLIENNDLRESISYNAINTVKTTYSPSTAAYRLLSLSESILSGAPRFFDNSICSLI